MFQYPYHTIFGCTCRYHAGVAGAAACSNVGPTVASPPTSWLGKLAGMCAGPISVRPVQPCRAQWATNVGRVLTLPHPTNVVLRLRSTVVIVVASSSCIWWVGWCFRASTLRYGVLILLRLGACVSYVPNAAHYPKAPIANLCGPVM